MPKFLLLALLCLLSVLASPTNGQGQHITKSPDSHHNKGHDNGQGDSHPYNHTNGHDNSFRHLQEGFSSPDNAYGSAPLWVWHTRVPRAIIDSMMQEFKDNAFGGVMVHPRPGLITEYLSPEWLDLYQYTIEKGKALGLYVWIYDENSYPSGFGGGNVPDQMPESYNQGQMLHMIKTAEIPAQREDIFVALKKEGNRFVDITRRLDTEKDHTGSYYLFKKQFYQPQDGIVGPPEFPYVDLMVKGVTEKFLEVTMSGYEKIAGKDFGKAVPGLFSDEPSIPAHGAGNIRWTPDLFSSFRQLWGYDLEPHLPSLFETSGDWKKIRHNYQRTLLHLFIERWSKPMYAYTEKHNLKWTGHYWEHGWPNPGEGPDNMAMYAWHQQPGIDMLFNQFNEESPNAQFGNIRAVKELSSVANQLNRKRTLSETYGGGGWELSFKDMKRLGDWQYVLGVNFLNQHLSMMTLTGARKYDYPQSFSYHTPWWPYYKPLNEYYTRLSFALSQGSQQYDILIIEPTSSAWMYAGPGHAQPGLTAIGNGFQQFITALEKAQVEYDLGSENIIRDHGKTEKGKFIVGHRAYSTVVIPPGMENIDRATWDLLKVYTASGGKLLLFDTLQRVDGAVNNELIYLNTAGSAVRQFPGLAPSIIEQHFRQPDFQIQPAEPGVIGGNLYHHRRILDDGQLLFLSNASMEATATGTVQTIGRDAILMDPTTGEIWSYPVEGQEKQGNRTLAMPPSAQGQPVRQGPSAQQQPAQQVQPAQQSRPEQSDRISLQFSISPAGSLLLFFANEKQQGLKKYQSANSMASETTPATPVKGGPIKGSPIKSGLIKSGPIKTIRPAENTLMIDFCDVAFADTLLTDAHVGAASRAVFMHYGFNRNPWNHQLQFKNRIVERDTFSMGTGFTASYHFRIDGQVDFKKFRAVIEQRSLWTKIMVNGNTIEPLAGEWWLDRSFGVLNIGPYLKQGQNTLSITVNPMSVYAEIEPVYILGDFNLHPAEKGWQISAPRPLQPGSWQKQGLPLYGFGVRYAKEFRFRNTDGRFELQLGEWKGTVAAVTVNGARAGIIFSEPHNLDITKYLKRGRNRVEVEIIGSLKNLLGPHHNSPAPGMVGPGHWWNISSYPGGESYDVHDYGLMDDFQIRQYAGQ